MINHFPEAVDLLRDARRRAEPVLALAAARVWPEAELRVLTRFLHVEVLPRADREDAVVRAPGADAPPAELSAEHQALHTLTARLDQAEPASCRIPELTYLIEELLLTLEHHLAAEHAFLDALPRLCDVLDISVTSAAPGMQDQQVVSLLGALPVNRAAQICADTLERLNALSVPTHPTFAD